MIDRKKKMSVIEISLIYFDTRDIAIFKTFLKGILIL